MLRLVACIGALVGLAALAVPATSGASSPPLPPGTTSRAVTPAVYPGGGVLHYGTASAAAVPAIGSALNSPLVGMAASPTGQGIWVVGADGGVFTGGSAGFYGSAGNLELDGPIIAISATHDGAGYWLAAIDGGVFTYGDALFHGSMGGQHLNQPIVGMAPTADGGGYWLVASDGGIFSFGDAPFYGSMGNKPLNQPIVGMAATQSGHGYWLVASDGGVFTFGDAGFFGSAGGQSLGNSVTGMAALPNGTGYWLLLSDGGIFGYGDAVSQGSPATVGAATPFNAIAASSIGQGYWLLDPDAYNYTFANPPPNGTFPGSAAIVAAAESQIRPDPYTGYFCNPYGPCEEWCALFATWAWQQGGWAIPSYAFTGDIYYWSAANGAVLPPSATPVPGDAVLYGTSPYSTATSVHTGIVAQVWPDGAVVTIEGDAGPSATGHLAVITNGPYLPSQSLNYNGFGIYAWAQP